MFALTAGDATQRRLPRGACNGAGGCLTTGPWAPHNDGVRGRGLPLSCVCITDAAWRRMESHLAIGPGFEFVRMLGVLLVGLRFQVPEKALLRVVEAPDAVTNYRDAKIIADLHLDSAAYRKGDVNYGHS
jgi:hypothetical protein